MEASCTRGLNVFTDWGFPDSSVGKESACNAGDLGWILGSERFRWMNDRLPTPVFLDFRCGSAGKESSRDAGYLGSIPGLGRSPEEGKGYPLQYSGLETSMDYTVHGILQARILEWAAVPFSRGSSQPRD